MKKNKRVLFLVAVDMNGDEASEVSKAHIKRLLNDALTPFAQDTYGYKWRVSVCDYETFQSPKDTFPVPLGEEK